MLTATEKQELKEISSNLSFMANLVSKALAEPADDFGISDLVPTGKLGEVATKIKENQVITDEEFEKLVAIAQKDIETHSRLDGLLKNMTQIAVAIRPILLSLIGA